MIYLDTHVVVWLYAGLFDKLSPLAIQLIEEHDIFISPILQLELTYLFEIKKIRCVADEILHELHQKIGLKLCELPFELIVNRATSLTWVRDPFDRLITAQTLANPHSLLVTKDRVIRKYCEQAVW